MVDCSGLSTEQVEAILERIWELGGVKKGVEGLTYTYYNLHWEGDNNVWFSSQPFGFYPSHLREVEAQDIFPETITLNTDSVSNFYEENVMNNFKNTYINIKHLTPEEIIELAKKYSEVSGYPLEAYLELFTTHSIPRLR